MYEYMYLSLYVCMYVLHEYMSIRTCSCTYNFCLYACMDVVYIYVVVKGCTHERIYTNTPELAGASIGFRV